MKRFSMIGAYLVVLLICVVVGTFCCTSCNKIVKSPTEQIDIPDVDSLAIASIKAAIVNPVFETASDVLVFRNNKIEESRVDSLFLTLPDKTLLDVYSVCSKKYDSVNKFTMMDEYRANRQVYDNLSSTPQEIQTAIQTTNTKEPTAMEEQQTRVVSTEGDTIISGKKYKRLITLEPYE